MNKKSIAIVAGLLMAGSLNSLAIGNNNTKCQPFKMTQVHLLPSRFQENMKRDSAWMMSGSVNSLLQSFRNTSGAFSSREGGYDGEEARWLGITRLRLAWSYHGTSSLSIRHALCPDRFESR